MNCSRKQIWFLAKSVEERKKIFHAVALNCVTAEEQENIHNGLGIIYIECESVLHTTIGADTIIETNMF